MLNRRLFTQAMVAGLAAPAVLKAQSQMKVAIIGAGSAGLTAAYHLRKSGHDVQVFEASTRWGGRMKRLSGFASVPLDHGAEWIHTEPEVFGQILGEGRDAMGVEIIIYNPETHFFWHENRLRSLNLLRYFYEEVKFLDTTWYGFFERFVVPSISGRINLGAVVSGIESSGAGLALRFQGGRRFDADKVLVAAPLSILQDGRIALSDDLFADQLSELANVTFGEGYKIFFRFRDRFYPDLLSFGPRSNVLEDTWDQKLFYDAALGKGIDDNILGLFNVSEGALPRVRLTDAAMIEAALDELTAVYGGEVRAGFIGAKVQNWSGEPHIRGSYSMTNNSDMYLDEILAPIDGRLFFAGEMLGDEAQSTVHGAAFSGIRAVTQMTA